MTDILLLLKVNVKMLQACQMGNGCLMLNCLMWNVFSYTKQCPRDMANIYLLHPSIILNPSGRGTRYLIVCSPGLAVSVTAHFLVS